VLVVDDDPGICTIVARALAGEGYEVRSVSDALEALKAVLADPPAVVVLDVGMPRLDGWELCEILRRQTTTRDVPVLFLTGHAGVRDQITAMQVGGSDFVSKPFRADDLRAKVRALAAEGRHGGNRAQG
jgi:two-component system OmpR family response regulator